MNRRILPVALSLCVFAVAGAAHAQDDFSFDIVEEAVVDTDQQKLLDAKDALAQERFADALAGFVAVLDDKKMSKFHDEANYNIGKTLYRMDAYHAALARFTPILEEGPKHPFFEQTREWLFFIARKTKDELAALALISRYAKPGDIPKEYESELSFSLARYYFLLALQQGAKGVEVEATPEEQAPPEVEQSEGMDFSSPDTEEPPAEEGGDGFNFSDEDLGGGDDDGFDFDMGDVKVDKKKPAKKKVDKKADKKKADPEPAVAAPEPAPAPPPPAKKAEHKNQNPQNADESLKLVIQNLERVKPEFERYAQALYLRGLAHFGLGAFEPAVKAFREVVRMTNPRGGTIENPKLREMAFFSLARIHYQFEQFRYAIFYYERIDRDSEAWLDALFESSWAHFRLGEYEKALGNLVTIQSPFFRDEYYPESSILKAITFFENCRYPEARAFLDEFRQNYGGVLDELDRLVGKQGPKTADASGTATPPPEAKTAEQLYDELAALNAKVEDGQDDAARSSALTARLLRLALSDKRVKSLQEAIAETEAEKLALESMAAPFSGSPLQTELIGVADVRRKELAAAAGALLRDRLESERTFLNDLSSKLLRIQFEIAKQEKETLEASISQQQQGVEQYQYFFTPATDDERVYWPFDGEYWRDELGTYQYTLTKGCRPPSDTTISGN